jgi:hypothetical protein
LRNRTQANNRRRHQRNNPLIAINQPTNQKNNPRRAISRPTATNQPGKQKNSPLRAIKRRSNQAMRQEEEAVAAEVEKDLEVADQRTMQSLPTVAVSRHAL